jgi:outer membrane receptor protein involved in Fe transport
MYNLIKELMVVGEVLFASKQNRLSSGDIDDNRIPDGGTEGWTNLSFYVNYTYNNFDFYLGIMNLLDEDYRYHGSGINMYGRSLKIGFNYNLEIL